MTGSLEDLKSKKFWAALLAELMGTAYLVILACGSAASIGVHTTNVVKISLCFGLAVASIVWAIAHVSGGHINPAVTIGFLVTRKISLVRAIFYMVAQVIGAIVGAGLLRVLTPDKTWGLGTSGPGTNISSGQVFGVELLITFIFLFVIFATCDGQRSGFGGSGPLAIGLSLCACHLWAVPYTGAGMNPARVFGPALISGQWTDHWAYWVGPLLGGALAALLYDHVFATNATPAKVKAFFTERDYDDSNFDQHGRAHERTNVQELKATA